jgi:SAM-dependent methyltransferase
VAALGAAVAIWTGLLHRLLQRALAPGASRQFDDHLRPWLAAPSPGASAEWVLDVGAGSRSRLIGSGRRTVAVDISVWRSVAAARHGALAVVASADALPFRTGAFQATACIGLLHHLADEAAAQAVLELTRVTAAGGRTVILDAVLPEPPARRPLARLIRRFDRGRWMRRQPALEVLLASSHTWTLERLTYSWTGLEGLVAARRKT